MLVGQIIAARPHAVDGFHSQRLGIQFDAGHELAQHGDDLVGEDDHLRRGGQTCLNIAYIVNEVSPDQQGDHHREEGVGGSLFVHRVAVGMTGIAPVR